ncbi:MAG: hypothetical protein RTU30_06830 [Candidatus Thorarchaeota archaeon]
MGAEKIVDYGQVRRISLIFGIILISFIVVGFLRRVTGPGDFDSLLVVYIVIPMLLFFISLVLGYGAKKTIDYIPGKWEKEKKWIPFDEYDNIIKKYEGAYGPLFSSDDNTLYACCCLPFVAIAMGFLFLFFSPLLGPLVGEPYDTILLVAIQYGVVGVGSYYMAFRAASIDEKEFFKPIETGSVFEYAQALAEVPDLRAGAFVEIGTRAGYQTIISAEIKTYVTDLPETVSVQVQVSHSGFDYPYLVGTIYKGPNLGKDEKWFTLKTSYPAMIEYSMDEDVTVLVARFDIPSRTSSVPSISKRDFQHLAQLLAMKLKEHYEEVN